jgi:hypothetical protein
MEEFDKHMYITKITDIFFNNKDNNKIISILNAYSNLENIKYILNNLNYTYKINYNKENDNNIEFNMTYYEYEFKKNIYNNLLIYNYDFIKLFYLKIKNSLL